MSNKRLSITENSDRAFISEVSGRCPLCGNELIVKKGKNKVKRYQIAHIYPLNATVEEQDILKNEKRLSDFVDDDNNKIALCVDCHILYDQKKNVDEYRKLFNIKLKILNRSSMHQLLHLVNIENAIIDIVEKLSSFEKSGKVDINIEPVKVDQKIDDALLSTKIKGFVREYYNFVDECFKTQSLTDASYNNILMSFKMAYNNIKNITKNQQEIYNELVLWLKEKTHSLENIACEVVISYFIQHCEVFDVISQ